MWPVYMTNEERGVVPDHVTRGKEGRIFKGGKETNRTSAFRFWSYQLEQGKKPRRLGV